MRESVQILGVRVDDIDSSALLGEIAERIRRGKRDVMCYVNVHAVSLARRDTEFREILNHSSVSYCDGEGVRLGARVLGVRLPPRIVMTYWIWELSAMCAREGFSLFLLGGAMGAAEQAARNLVSRFPALKIAGWYHGYFDTLGPDNEQVVNLVNSARPDVLLICLGMPLQEKWFDANRAALQARIVLFGGSAIDYTAGRKKLTPAWMAIRGLEWLYRLTQEPGRLWRRYIFGIPLYLARVCVQRVREGRQG